MNNWHWYLKQEFLFGSLKSGDEVLSFHWDEEDPMKLVGICKSGEISQFLFHWGTDVSQGLDHNNQSTVSVIDGNNLLITPIRRLVPPPPMAATTLNTKSSIKQIFYAPKTYDIFIIHSNQTISCYKTMNLPPYEPGVKKAGIKGFIGTGTPPIFDQNPEFLGNLNPQNNLDISSFYQWRCFNSKKLFAISCRLDDVTSKSIFEFVILDYSISNESVSENNRILIQGVPLCLYSNSDTKSVFISLANGEIVKYHENNNQLEHYCKLPTPCSVIESVYFGTKPESSSSTSNALSLNDIDDIDDFADDLSDDNNTNAPDGLEEILIALNDRSRLYINGEECSRECNSFAIHERYILFSTLTHKLRFIDHSFPFSRDLLETTPKHNYDVCNRELERGSRIVAVVPYDTKVVLQMPRGNLETIYPRALLLSHCRILLNQNDYRNAFLKMRHHRIDLNLLYDNNPTQFLNNIDHFINSLDSPTFLNLFLSSLKDEDVTITLYPQKIYQDISSQIQLPSYLTRDHTRLGKINKICMAIRDSLVANNPDYQSNRYLLSILTTLVKQSPPQFGEALELVRKLKKIEKSSQSNSSSSSSASITAEGALDYMVFLVDVNKLYDVALSLYDFELTIMVASKSQKDPKEYLPFLKELHELQPIDYQKYSIDMHLQNYEKALQNVVTLLLSHNDEDIKSKYLENVVDQSSSSATSSPNYLTLAIDLIKSKKLYALALKLFSKSKVISAKIQEIFADYLFENSEYYESGILYQRCGLLEKSLTAFSKTSNWQMVFMLAVRLNYNSEKTLALANDLASTYRNMGYFDEAARILVEYANDPTTAIDCLTQGCLWTNALRLCYKFNLENLIEEQIDPAVQESQMITLEMVENKYESYKKQFERLKIVKRSKLLMPKIDSLPSDPNLGDVFSETSSFASSRSSFSYLSVSEGGTKQRKRKKKKRISGKEGSLYEEEYLVDALKKLIPTEFDRNELHELLKILLLLGYNNDAEELQTIYSKFCELIESSLEVLIAPIVPMPGHEEEHEEDLKIKDKIETKEKMDRLFKPSAWKLSTLSI